MKIRWINNNHLVRFTELSKKREKNKTTNRKHSFISKPVPNNHEHNNWTLHCNDIVETFVYVYSIDIRAYSFLEYFKFRMQTIFLKRCWKNSTHKHKCTCQQGLQNDMSKPNYSHYKRKHLSLGNVYFLVKRMNAAWSLDSWLSWCGLWFTTITIWFCL